MQKKIEYIISNFRKNAFVINGFLIKKGKTEIDKNLYETLKEHSLIKELLKNNLIILIKREKCL